MVWKWNDWSIELFKGNVGLSRLNSKTLRLLVAHTDLLQPTAHNAVHWYPNRHSCKFSKISGPQRDAKKSEKDSPRYGTCTFCEL